MAASKKNAKKLQNNAKKVVKPKIKTGAKKSKPAQTSTLKNILRSVKNAVKLSHTPKKLPPLDKINAAFNKSQLISTLAERTDLNKKQVTLVMDEFCKIMGVHLKKGGPEKFILPGAFKIVVRKIAAKKARNGVNPFTGEPAVFKAKPASRKVKIIALKSLKDMAL